MRDPLVATNGDTFLTLWTTEAGAPGKFIYGLVADAGGHRTSQASFRLLPFSAELVDVASFGAGYLVLWQNASGLHSSILSGAGVVLRDGPTIPPPTNRFTDVQTNGKTVLFTYHTSDPLAWPTETRAQLSSMDGVPIGSSIFLGNQALQAATAVGDDYVTVTTEESGTYFLRVDKTGRVVVPKQLIAATVSLQNVVAASDGSGILVATLGMFIALSGDGTVLHTRSVAPEPGSESSLIWIGDSYLHIRRKGFDAVAQHLDRMGMPVGDPLTLGAGVSSAATHDGVVYAAGRTEDRGNVGFVLTAANAALSGGGEVLSITPAVQTAPVIASDGVGFLDGWAEEVARSHKLGVTRISSAAVPLDVQPVDLGPVDAPERAGSLSLDAPSGHHAVACNGQTCLAVWANAYDIRGRWIVAGNANETSFAIGRGKISGQAVVWNGHEFFVVWNAGPLYSSTVSTAGVVSTPRQITLWQDNSSPPEVAWDGHRYLLMTTFDAGACDCPGSRSGISLYGITTDGKLSPGDGFLADFLDAHLTASDHDFLVIYDHYDSLAYPQTEVAARRIVATDTSVEVAPATPLFRWIGPASSSVTWNGQDYVAAWRYGIGSSWWITSARVTSSAFPDRRATAGGVPDRQVKPAIATNAAGESVILNSESSAPGEPARLRAYAERDFGALPPLPSAPSAVYATGTASRLTVHWQSDGRDVAGFVVQRSDGGSVIAAVGPEERSAVFSGATSVQVHAFNASGLSEVGVANPRRRASR